MWMIRRTAVIVATLAVICAAVVGIARTNAVPSRLQALGFGVCEGEPCWRGIKVGMRWEEAKRRLPEAIEQYEHGLLYLISALKSSEPVTIKMMASDGFVSFISVSQQGAASVFPLIKAGDIIVRYGPPCRVTIIPINFGPAQLRLHFPTLTIEVYHPIRSSATRLRVDSGVYSFNVSREDNGACERSTDTWIRPWYGFTSLMVYYVRGHR
jgi:hypothetical protein